MAMSAKRSCAGQLHKIQKSFGLSDKDLKNAAREVARPREVKLPTFHEKTPRGVKKQQKIAETVGAKRRRYELAYWYLEEYLDPMLANDVYRKYPKFKDLVDHAYDRAIGIIQIGTYVVSDDVDLREVFPDRPDDDLDIPVIQWNEFNAYCKKHPLKHGAKDIFPRRRKFKKYIRKRRGKYYSKRRMKMYDPLFAMTIVDEKEMVKNLERITRENEQRVKKFHEMLDALVTDRSIGAEALRQFDKQTKDIMRQHKKRMNMFMERIGQKPTSVEFDIDDEPTFRA